MAAPRTGRHGNGVVSSWAPVATEAITFPGPRGTLHGGVGGRRALARRRARDPREPRASPSTSARSRAASPRAGTPRSRSTCSPRRAARRVRRRGARWPRRSAQAARRTRFDADMKAARRPSSASGCRGKRVGAIGFCFGGGMIWRLLAVGRGRAWQPRRRSTARSRRAATCAGSSAAVLGVYGGLDDRVNATLPSGRGGAAGGRGSSYEILTFTDADHAFFNDTGAALQRAGGRGGLPARARLVRPPRGEGAPAPRRPRPRRRRPRPGKGPARRRRLAGPTSRGPRNVCGVAP